jgi:hypothetical protein
VIEEVAVWPPISKDGGTDRIFTASFDRPRSWRRQHQVPPLWASCLYPQRLGRSNRGQLRSHVVARVTYEAGALPSINDLNVKNKSPLLGAGAYVR